MAVFVAPLKDDGQAALAQGMPPSAVRSFPLEMLDFGGQQQQPQQAPPVMLDGMGVTPDATVDYGPSVSSAQQNYDDMVKARDAYLGQMSDAQSRAADAYGQMANIQMAPPNVQPISRNELNAAALVAALGIAGGARNATQAFDAYTGGRRQMMAQDYQNRANQYQMAYRHLDSIAQQLAAQAKVAQTGYGQANTNVERAARLLSTAYGNKAKQDETSRLNDAKIQNWETRSANQAQQIALTHQDRIAKIKSAEDIFQQAEQGRNDRNDANNQTRMAGFNAMLQAVGIRADNAMRIAQMASNNHDYATQVRAWLGNAGQVLGAAKDTMDKARARYEGAKSRYAQAFSVDTKGQYKYGDEARAFALAELNAAANEVDNSQAHYGTAVQTALANPPQPAPMPLPKAQAPGTGQSNPLTPFQVSPSRGTLGRLGRSTAPPSGVSVIRGKGSTFGGYDDPDDNGRTASGYVTGNMPSSQGDWIALRPSDAKQMGVKFGDRVTIRNPYTGNTVTGVYRDTGPAKYTGRRIDMAKGLMNALRGQTDMQFEFWKAQ